MGTLKPNMAASLLRIRSVLMDDWDPIGVQGVPEAADEYDFYVMPIYTLLRQDHSEKAVLDYLLWMTERMGLPASRDSLRPFAGKLLQIDVSRDEIHQ